MPRFLAILWAALSVESECVPLLYPMTGQERGCWCVARRARLTTFMSRAHRHPGDEGGGLETVELFSLELALEASWAGSPSSVFIARCERALARQMARFLAHSVGSAR